MGLLVEGVWRDADHEFDSAGRFIRKESQFRETVSTDGGRYPAQSGRYHLYASLACPWAHRTLIMRALKGLEDHISISVVHWTMLDQGWTFEMGDGVIPDPGGARHLYEIYTRADPIYSGRTTVPILWDKQTGEIVNNESSEIIRILNSQFNAWASSQEDYYPEALREEIDAVNARIYATLNNGVYRAGFAATQAAYEEAVHPLFETLDWLEARLSDRTWLVGERMTEADIRLFTTLVRFDLVYHGHFKCNLKKISEYPNLSAYGSRIYQLPKIADTVSVDHIKRHYYGSHKSINPTGIVPAGPANPMAAKGSTTGLKTS